MTVRRNILVGWLSHALTLLVGLYLVRFVKNSLGDSGYGAWIFVNSIAGYSGLLYMGFGAAVCRYSARYYTLKDWPGLNRVLSSIFAIYVFNSLLAIAAAGGFAAVAQHVSDWEGESLSNVRIVVMLLGLNAAAGLWGSVFCGLLVGIQRYDVRRYIHIGSTVLRLVLTVLVLERWPGLVAMSVAFLLITLIENVAYLVCARWLVPQLQIRRDLIELSALKECYSFTAFNVIAMVSGYLIALTDTVVIGCVLGTAATVPYYIAQRLCQMAQTPFESISEVLLPKAGELHARQDTARLQDLVIKWTGLSLLLIGGFAIGATYFGERVLRTWLGPGNEASQPILLILVAAQVIALPLRIPKTILMGMGEVRLPAVLDLVQALANLVLSLVLIQKWGVIGVAWGTLIPAVLCDAGLLLPCLLRRLQLPFRRIMVEIIAPQILPWAVLVLFCEFALQLGLRETWPNLALISGLGGALVVGVWGAVQWAAARGRKLGNPAGELVAS